MTEFDPGDPRLCNLDSAFERLVVELGRRFARLGQARGGRAFHLRATTLAGELTVLPAPAVPPHPFFAAGRRFPALVRHANGAQDDDCVADSRGATVRLLASASPDDLAASQLDLLLTTGRCFLQATAAGFARWSAATPAQREAWAHEQPQVGAAAWDMLRRADSFATLTYHAKVANHWIAADGGAWYARYRLVPADGTPDHGFLEPGDRVLPPESVPRLAGDARAPTLLHDDLRARVAAGAVRYTLQVQLRPDRDDDRELALDCTRPWHESQHSWHDLAALRLDRVLAEGVADELHFNPRHAPPGLGLVLATSAESTASLNHLRSLVYDFAAAARTGTPLPSGLRTLDEGLGARSVTAPKTSAPPLRVGVLGGGASGLTAARALERRGHRVTVLEGMTEVGGKCDSLFVNGLAFDWGGHFCYDNYRALGRLVAELGVATEPTQPAVVYDVDARRPWAPPDQAAFGAHWLRYVRLRDRAFAGIRRPGLAALAPALARPARAWLAEHDLAEFAQTLALTYAASGYGRLDDPELAALYFLKAVETTVGAAPGGPLPAAWTVQGGFLNLWERVAEGLRDLRRDHEVLRVERGAAGVRVHTTEGLLDFDVVVVATPLHAVPAFLDATPEERAIFGRVRHVDYYTTVFAARGLPTEGLYLLKQHADDPAGVGHTLALHHRYPGDDTYLAYANGRGGLDGDGIERRLRADVARLGGSVETVYAQRRWDHFPHFKAGDVADGIIARLEALQGRNRTYWVGSLLNFELVECNVAYAEDLVERHFGPALAVERHVGPAQTTERSPGAPGFAGVAGAPGFAGFAGFAGVAGVDLAVMTELLRRAVAAELGLGELPPASVAFAELGLDSLRATSLLQRLAGETGRALTPTTFADFATLADLAAHLAGEAAPYDAEAARGYASLPVPQFNASVTMRAPQFNVAVTMRAPSAGASPPSAQWVPLRPTPRVRLLCFHHAGGGPADFARWPDALPLDVEVLALQMPGRGAPSAPAFERLDDLLDALEPTIAPLLDVPCAFFGHGLGAVAAFELALRLRRRGLPGPVHLFVSGFRAPGGGAQGRAVNEREPADGAWMTPEVRADLRLLAAWRHVPEEPLDVPISALGGRSDPVAHPDDLAGWATFTRGEFQRHLFAGGHFYLRDDPAGPLAVVRHRLAARADGADPPGARHDVALAELGARWRARPAAFTGGLRLYDLCWVARAAAHDGTPRFPEALAALLAAWQPQGGFAPPGALAASDLAVLLAYANTLLRWRAAPDLGADVLRHLVADLDRLGDLPDVVAPQPHGRHFRFTGPMGHGVVIQHEGERLLADDGAALEDADRARLARLVASLRARNPDLDRIDHAGCFQGGSPLLVFAEFFPVPAFFSEPARAYAEAPGALAPVAARHAELCDSPASTDNLRALLARPEDGLWPAGRVLEDCFALYYLAQGGVDARRHFPGELARLGAYLRRDGVGSYDGAPAPDCDATAVALAAAHAFGVASRLPTEWLDRLWAPAHDAYLASDGSPAPDVATEVHVAEAYLTAPDVTPARRREVWQRTVRLLGGRAWHGRAHVSPFFVWELVVRFGFRHGPASAPDAGDVHHAALAQILGHQAANGGFQSGYVAAPSQEETALALLGLGAAARALAPGLPLRRRVDEAVARGRAFLLAEREAPGRPRQALWAAKVLAGAPHLDDAIVLASLAATERDPG